jgi:hypothetical protein
VIALLAQASLELLQNPNLLQGAGLGGLLWILRRLSRLETIVRRTHAENMHARRVIAAKLGIQDNELTLPADAGESL